MYPTLLHPSLPEKSTTVEPAATPREFHRERMYSSSCSSEVLRICNTLEWLNPRPLTGPQIISIFSLFL